MRSILRYALILPVLAACSVVTEDEAARSDDELSQSTTVPNAGNGLYGSLIIWDRAPSGEFLLQTSMAQPVGGKYVYAYGDDAAFKDLTPYVTPCVRPDGAAIEGCNPDVKRSPWASGDSDGPTLKHRMLGGQPTGSWIDTIVRYGRPLAAPADARIPDDGDPLVLLFKPLHFDIPMIGQRPEGDRKLLCSADAHLAIAGEMRLVDKAAPAAELAQARLDYATSRDKASPNRAAAAAALEEFYAKHSVKLDAVGEPSSADSGPVFAMSYTTADPRYAVAPSKVAECRAHDGKEHIDACTNGCAYYACSEQCWPTGTANEIACPEAGAATANWWQDSVAGATKSPLTLRYRGLRLDVPVCADGRACSPMTTLAKLQQFILEVDAGYGACDASLNGDACTTPVVEMTLEDPATKSAKTYAAPLRFQYVPKQFRARCQ